MTLSREYASRKLAAKTLLSILSWLVVLVFILPGAVILINSFKDKNEASTMDLALPAVLRPENYATVFEKGNLAVTFLNSGLYAAGSSALTVALTLSAAFVLSRRKDRRSSVIYFFIVLGTALPMNYVALMKVMKGLALINTRLGLVLLYAAIAIPISLFIAYGYVSTLPREIDEAAVIDGCSPRTLFVLVIAPLLKPIAATVFVLDFMSSWNDFIMPLYFLNSTRTWPMTLGVYNFFGMYQTQWNLVSADIALTSLPVLIVFVFGQKYIVGGITAGAVKG
jgi:raffinose/stachyose/melibiose transport system permease protein